MSQSERKRVIVAVTGASGALYARRLIECLLNAACEVHLIVSPYGRMLLEDELGIRELTPASLTGREVSGLVLHPYRDVGSVLGSGSFRTCGMIVCPCSTNSMAAMAAGLGSNLIERAAAVTLKEKRRLVVVPREMPWTRIDLENALRLDQAGAVICPACPGFYMLPESLMDVVDFVVAKLLDLVDVPHTLNTRWQTSAAYTARHDAGPTAAPEGAQS